MITKFTTCGYKSGCSVDVSPYTISFQTKEKSGQTAKGYLSIFIRLFK